jgi:hypothetical protein
VINDERAKRLRRAECATPRSNREVGVAVALGSPRTSEPTAATVAAEFGRVG